MYQYLRNLLNLADQVGYVEDVSMGDWLKTSDRIKITGTSKTGHGFSLELEIQKEEPQQ